MIRARSWTTIAALVAATWLLGTGTAEAQARTATPKCPATLTSQKVANGWPATRTTLIPGGVQSLVMCWYKPPSLPQSGPLEHRVLVPSGQTLTMLVDGLRALPRTMPGAQPGLPVNCPADFGANVLLLASYRQRAPVKLLIDKSGCEYATNGSVTVYFDGGGATASALVATLQRLLPWSELPAPSASPPSTTARARRSGR